MTRTRYRIIASLTLTIACVSSLLPTTALADDSDPAIREARKLADSGNFSDAETLLDKKIKDETSPIVDTIATEREILRRVRLDYSLTGDMMLKKLRESIPDVTGRDIAKWRETGLLQHRIIDGNVHYFKREPSNLFRFCQKARERRKKSDQPEPAGWNFSLPDHLAHLIKLAEKSTQPEIFPVRHRVTYRLSVKKDHPRLKAGAVVRCWLPFPQEYRQQQKVRLIKATPDGSTISKNGTAHRCIYLEQTISDPKKPPVFSAEFEFETSAYCPDLSPDKVRSYDTSSSLYAKFTAERPPHILITPDVRKIVKNAIGSETNPLLKAKKLFHWVDANIRYCSEMEYSTLRNISEKALSARCGDCGVQGLCFITLCRAAGIPARWQSGWETKPNGRNMHDWVEFYIEPFGWLPADPSYGIQKHDDPRVRDFYCGNMDPYRLIVNLDFGQPLTPGKTSFRSEPNDFQRGEIEIDGHNLYFDEWTWSFDVDTVPQTVDFTALEEALDAAIPKYLKRGTVPGAVILVGKRNGDKYDTWKKAYGYKQIKPNAVPMPADAIFDLASMSKPIAAGTSLMILSDRGQLDVDDPVGKYLPEFQTGKKKTAKIRHLMTHMSGEKPYLSVSEQNQVKEKAGFPCRKEIRDFIRGVDLVREPGEAVQYSCLNAILCAEVVRHITGMEHSEFVAKNAFGPLGMKDTGFNPGREYDQRLVPTEPKDYGRGPDHFLLGQVHDPLAALQGGISGNAGLYSSVDDLSRFAQMVLNGGELDGVRILKPDTVERMTHVANPGGKHVKGYADRRGLLWDIYKPDADDTGVDAIYAFGHTGYTGTAIRFYPERGIYILALTNRVHPNDKASVGPLRLAVWRTVGEVLMGVKP